MRSLSVFRLVRRPVDDGVDRLDMEASQGVEWTGTNRRELNLLLVPDGNDIHAHYAILRQHCFRLDRHHHPFPVTGVSVWVGGSLDRLLYSMVCLVVRAEVTHPVPFRTRSLRLPAPMVLHSRGCGRAGHRQTLNI